MSFHSHDTDTDTLKPIEFFQKNFSLPLATFVNMCYYIGMEDKCRNYQKGAVIMNHEEIFRARVKAARYDQLCYLATNAKILTIIGGLYCLWYFNA